MHQSEKVQPAYSVYLEGGGEMGNLTRSFDWSSTSIGGPEKWSQNLLTILNTILNSKFPMFLWWGQELIQFYNDAYRPSLGNQGKHPKALGQKGADCWPEIWPVISPLIEQVLAGGESTWNEDQLIPIYRNEILEDVYWTFSYSKVLGHTGKIEGVLVTCTETTGKMKNKQEIEQTLTKLTESEYTLHNLIEKAPVAIGVLKTRDLVVETANEKILQLWGKSSTVLGMPLAQALPELAGQPFLDILDQVFTTGIPYRNSEVAAILDHDGILKKYYFDLLYQPMPNSEGNPEGILIVATDLTEQVKARQQVEENFLQFRQLADSIIQMVWVTDADGMHEYYNQRWYDFTGSDYNSTRGVGWNLMFHPEDRDRAWQAWKHSLETGNPYEIEYRLRKHDGEFVWVLGRAAPFYDGEGKIIKWFGTCTDIHDQKLLQDQKDDFISIASHELKTPITSLKASLQLMARMANKPSPQLMETLIEKANRNIEKVGVLIEDLLNASKFNNGQLHLRVETFNIANLAVDYAEQINQEGHFLINISGEMNLEVTADKERIGQIITNFITNAIKYAPDSKSMDIRIDRVDDGVKLSVTDKGPGISADKIPHLFDRYYRVDSSGSQYSGLGLGLYICAEIIKRHNGQIGVDSTLGEGSCFWFVVPYAG